MEMNITMAEIKVGTRVRHRRTGSTGTVARSGRTVRVQWDGQRSTGGAHPRDLALLADDECSICGDTEPFHVHHGDKRIDDYFTVGRGMTDFEAAKAWRERALKAEKLLRDGTDAR